MICQRLPSLITAIYTARLSSINFVKKKILNRLLVLKHILRNAHDLIRNRVKMGNDIISRFLLKMNKGIKIFSNLSPKQTSKAIITSLAWIKNFSANITMELFVCLVALEVNFHALSLAVTWQVLKKLPSNTKVFSVKKIIFWKSCHMSILRMDKKFTTVLLRFQKN